MKSYLSLFVTIVSFTFVLNIAQAKIPERITQEHEKVWQVLGFDSDGNLVGYGTAFAIGKDKFVTNFHVISFANKFSKNSVKSIFLKKGEQILELSQILRIDAVEDLVIFKTNDEVTEYLELSNKISEKLSQKTLSGRFFVLGYPQGVEQTLIHSEKYKIFDNTYDNEYVMVMGNINLKGLSGGFVLDEQNKIVGIVLGNIDNSLFVRKVNKLEELQGLLIGLDCSELSVSACIEMGIADLKKRRSPRANYLLSQLIMNGQGIEENMEGEILKKVFELISQPENQKHILSTAMRVLMYYDGQVEEEGLGLDKDLELMLPLARKDISYAQGLVAKIYEKKGNIALARYWAYKARKNGSVEGTFLLAGLEKNEEKALELYLESGNKGHNLAKHTAATKLNESGIEENVNQSLKMFVELIDMKKQEYTRKALLQTLMGRDKEESCRETFN